MADYASEKGVKVQTVAGDPPAPFEGQVWYNSTTGSHRVSKGPLVDAWATGNDLNTARSSLAGAGIQTAALAFGTPSTTANTETYNGTSWTEVNDMNVARIQLGGAGTQTAALAIAGRIFPNPPPTNPTVDASTESWNGTNWTEVNDLNTARKILAAAGADNTSAIAFGGNPGTPSSDTNTGATESWNGTNWTEVNDLNNDRQYVAGTGTQTAALAFGGLPPVPGITAVTELWNGTNWTEVNDLNTARYQFAGAGTTTAALSFGGSPIPANGAKTESWNGTNWTEANDLNTRRAALGGAGANNTSALAFAGQVSPPVPGTTAATEEWGETGGNKSITSS